MARAGLAPILAFDTSGPWCAAALEGAAPVFVPMARGQAEALMPLLSDLLSGAGLGWADIGALAVGVGPGSFTGQRIAVAAARGLAMGRGCPAFGLSLFDVLAEGAPPGPCILSLPAPRGGAYVAGRGLPHALPAQEWPAGAAPPAPLSNPLPAQTRVIGHEAAGLARRLGLGANAAHAAELPAEAIAPALVRLARAQLARGEPPARPQPLYLRRPDAAPPRAAPPPLLP